MEFQFSIFIVFLPGSHVFSPISVDITLYPLSHSLQSFPEYPDLHMHEPLLQAELSRSKMYIVFLFDKVPLLLHLHAKNQKA